MSNELVSAILDGDCSASELHAFLSQVSNSPALMRQFSRMSAVRDALAGIPLRHASELETDDFCAGVMSGLGEMEAVERTLPATGVPNRPNVVTLPARARESASSRSRRSRPMAGWAAAASFSLVAIVGGRAWIGSGSTVNPENQKVAVNDTTGNVRSASGSGDAEFGLMPASSRGYLSSYGRTREIHWTHLDPEAAQELADSMSDSSHLHFAQSGRTYAQYAAMSADYLSVSSPR